MTLAILFESVGAGEWLVLLAVVLIVVGPKRLPATARKFGQHYAKFRRAAENFKRQLLEMDTEITNAVADAEKEVENAAKDMDPDLAPPDPSEYGGFDESEHDYGGYESEGQTSEPTPSEETPAPSEQPAPSEKPMIPPEQSKPTEKPAASLAGIKITVSPAPKPTEG